MPSSLHATAPSSPPRAPRTPHLPVPCHLQAEIELNYGQQLEKLYDKYSRPRQKSMVNVLRYAVQVVLVRFCVPPFSPSCFPAAVHRPKSRSW